MIKLEFQFYPIDEVTERLFDKEFCYIGNRVGERLWAFYGTKKEIDEKMSSLGLVILPYKEEYIDNSKILIRVKYKDQ